MATIQDVGAFYAKISQRLTFHNQGTSYLKLYQFLPVPVPVPVKVRVSRSPRDCGVLIPHPKWDKSPSLFSCVPYNICRVLYSYVSSNLCTRGKRKLFFRDQARLGNNFCGFVKFSITNSVQYCVQCSLIFLAYYSIQCRELGYAQCTTDKRGFSSGNKAALSAQLSQQF